MHTARILADGTEIVVYPGKKSPNDFIVKYRQPGKRERTPKHIHIIIDLYIKNIYNNPLTFCLVDHFLNNVIGRVQPSETFPPTFQVFRPGLSSHFSGLDYFGDYSAEFLLAVNELLIIQEKTNYPNGTLSSGLYSKFRTGADIFTVVSAATYR